MGALRAAAYDLLIGPLEGVWLGKLRRKLLAQTGGRVLEIGVGTGLNLPTILPHSISWGSTPIPAC